MARSCESDANDSKMVKKVESDSLGSSSTKTIPSTTYLGRKPVPVISSCQGLMDMIESFRKDTPYVAEILRRATIAFTDEQLGMIDNVLEGAWMEQEYGNDQQFNDALVVLEESLDNRVNEETEFFNHQKSLYSRIYEALIQSSFPYSSNQAACLHKMLRALYVATGNPHYEADKEIVTSLRELVRLLQLDDHLIDSTPHRVIVHNTIPFYLRNMVAKLEILAKEEGKRPHPSFIHPNVPIDLAIFLVVNLDALVILDKVLTPREHFHFGLVELYTKLVAIFKGSGLNFSNRQEVAIEKIERRVRDLKRSPTISKHYSIQEACHEFMRELEEASPDREVTLDEDGKVILAINGSVNKAVRDISWWLVNLQPAASAHLANFPIFGNGVENFIANITERFLSLYPMH